MRKTFDSFRWIIGAALLASAIGVGVLGLSSASMSDGREYDDDDDHEYGERSLSRFPENAAYVDECGACHLAYPPTLLPASSWEGVMSGLDDHFGENAELPKETADALRTYLVENAADRSDSRLGHKMLRGTGDAAPLRITELAYFRDEHDEVPARMVKDNPEVRSFSNCGACHERASDGVFDEDTVNIPGHGRWDD